MCFLTLLTSNPRFAKRFHRHGQQGGGEGRGRLWNGTKQ